MALSTNQVGYWKLDESSGNATDSSGNGYTLTNTNTVSYATGKINNGADFGSANTNKNLGTTSVIGLDMSTSFTQNLWVNPSVTPTNNGAAAVPIIWADNTTASKKGYNSIQWVVESGVQKIYINRADSAGNDQPVASQSMSNGTWYMLTFTWDGATQKLFFNGNSTPIISAASTRTGTNTTSGATEGFYLGRDITNSREWQGLIDEVGVWSRALTTTEIAQLYNSGTGLQYPYGTTYSITAEQGSYTLTGQAALFNKTLKLTSAQGSYSLTGQDVTFRLGKGLVATTGYYTLTGGSASLRKSGWNNLVKNESTASAVSKNSSTWDNLSRSL
jgi:hypothetical protein